MKYLTSLALILVMIAVSAFDSPEANLESDSVIESAQLWVVVCHFPGHEGDFKFRGPYKDVQDAVHVAKKLNRVGGCMGKPMGHAIAVSDDGCLNGHDPYNGCRKKKGQKPGKVTKG